MEGGGGLGIGSGFLSYEMGTKKIPFSKSLSLLCLDVLLPELFLLF